MTIPSIKLKHTDLEVSRYCFGTMTFGKPLDQAGSTQLVNRCIEAGINFFDTANMYQHGIAETMLGHAIKGKRDRLVIASKVFFKMGEEPDQQGLSRKAILRRHRRKPAATGHRLSRHLLFPCAGPRCSR